MSSTYCGRNFLTHYDDVSFECKCAYSSGLLMSFSWMVPVKMCFIWLSGAGARIELMMAAGQINGKVLKMLSHYK